MTLAEQHIWPREVGWQRREHHLAVSQYGMHGGWHTRMRLASAPQGDLGEWYRTCNLHSMFVYVLWKVLPPECVALGGEKVRSPRRGLKLATLQSASELLHYPRWTRDSINAALDLPTEDIEALATMTDLSRLGPR